MYMLKDNEFVYKGDTVKEKLGEAIRNIWHYAKQVLPCLYYTNYEEDGIQYFGIYREWFGYMFSIQTFPIGCGCGCDDDFEEDEEGMENDDDMEDMV